MTAASPWQRLYATAHRWRARWYAGRAKRLPRPAVSLGNLHWGGTGKTPLVAAVAARLRDRGLSVAVLSRGYGRSTRGPLLVSRGDGPEVDPWRAGEEPFLLAEQLPGVAVVVAERRHAGGLLALAELARPPDLFVLDDAFSHLALARDLDLLVLPAADPLAGGKLPPAGRLREPLAAAGRAHALLLTGAGAAPEAAREVARELRCFGFTGPAFAAPTRVAAPRLAAGDDPGREAGLLLVTGIARPERVRQAAEALGLALRGHLAYPDHHPYPPQSVGEITARCRELGALAVLTTAKDRVKLAGRLPLPLFELPLEVAPEEAFWSWL
ncbi:MAG TPA: tetraacyldisaccharide 4'-kinase, partial [Thermoanaerobaculia bacterium]|nr:tetraacyldisaccharide 4'-kinase [Thermoanaerobaculia bacterium]